MLEIARGPGRRADERERAAHPKRVGHPIEDRVEPRPEPPHRQLDPLVRPALGGKCRAHLGHHQSVRDEEQDDEDDGPRQRLKAVGGRLSDQIQPDDDRDGEEHHVEAAQRLDQMLLLLDCEGSLLGSAERWTVVTKPSFMVARPDARGTGSAVAARAYSLGDRMQRSKCPKALVTRADVAIRQSFISGHERAVGVTGDPFFPGDPPDGLRDRLRESRKRPSVQAI